MDFITNETKATINAKINEQYIDDVELALFCRSCCKNTADIMDTLCHVIVGISAIISFAAGSWDIKYLTFIAGMLNVISIVLAKLSAYNTSESKQYTVELNKITHQIGSGTIVDISDDPSITNVATSTANVVI